MRVFIVLAGILPLLVACSGGRSYHGALQCAPYARKITGVKLSGSAYSWWSQSRGRYFHTKIPRLGAILVFRKTSRLPDGHVSVVQKLKNSRTILVEHANWEAQKIDHKAPVIDVSPKNDWSMVRVWWAPSGRIGVRKYSTYGFIIPDRS